MLMSVPHFSGKGKFCKTKNARFPKRRCNLFAFLENELDACECIQSIQDREIEQSIMMSCIEGVKSILEAVKLLCLKGSLPL